MDFLDKVRQKAKEHDLQGKARRAADAAEKAAQDAVHKAGDIAHDKRDTVTSGLDKVAAKIDARTEGKYADRVAKAKVQLTKGVDRLADQRHDASEPSPAPEPPAPAAPAPPAAPPAPPASSTLHEPPQPEVSEPGA